MKMNSLVDKRCIQALYRASQAGVPVDLNIRGICCLRPGVEGVSEHIRVHSVVGRFLEHSRIYAFERNGDQTIYIGSADLMPRNLDTRVELLAPVRDEALRSELLDALERGMADNTNAWTLAAGRRLDAPRAVRVRAPQRAARADGASRGARGRAPRPAAPRGSGLRAGARDSLRRQEAAAAARSRSYHPVPVHRGRACRGGARAPRRRVPRARTSPRSRSRCARTVSTPARSTACAGLRPPACAASRRAAGSLSTASPGPRRGARSAVAGARGSASACSQRARGWDVAGAAVPARPPRLPVRPGRRRPRAAHRRGAAALPGLGRAGGRRARRRGDVLAPARAAAASPLIFAPPVAARSATASDRAATASTPVSTSRRRRHIDPRGRPRLRLLRGLDPGGYGNLV